MIAWFSVGALACGGFFGPDGAEMFSDAQQALFRPGADQVTVEYLVHYEGELQDFGWVIPVPGAFVSLEEGDEQAFYDLRWQTAPQIDYREDPSGGGGCGPATKGGDLSGGTSNGTLTVVDQGRAGVFEYVALAATDTAALVDWLDTHGWSVGPSGPSLDAYVQEGGWQFVAVALVEEIAPQGYGGETVARLTYDGSSLVFPARMSRYSMAPEQGTTVWVVGDQRASVSGWGEVELPSESVIGAWDLADAVGAAVLGGSPTYALTFSGELNGEWVTRFDTVAASSAHTTDPSFALDGGEQAFVPEIVVYENEDAKRADEGGCATGSTGAGPIALLAGAALAWRRRRGEPTPVR